jgi:hypothetical protein
MEKNYLKNDINKFYSLFVSYKFIIGFMRGISGFINLIVNLNLDFLKISKI